MDTSTEHIVTEGFLQKKSKYLGIYRKRWMVLTNKYLYSYKQKQKYKDSTEKFNLSKFKDVIKGRAPVLKTWDGSFGLIPSDSATKKSRWFITGSLNDMIKWIQHIKYALNNSNKENATQQHKNSTPTPDVSSRKTSNISDTSYTIKYILDNVSFTSNNTYDTDINYNNSLTTDTLLLLNTDLNTDLDYVNDIYEGVLEIQNDTFIEYDKYSYSCNNYEIEEKMAMKRDSVHMHSDSVSQKDRQQKQSVYDSEKFNELYVIGDKINDGAFGSVWRINNEPLKCVKSIELCRDVNGINELENGLETRRHAAISEYFVCIQICIRRAQVIINLIARIHVCFCLCVY